MPPQEEKGGREMRIVRLRKAGDTQQSHVERWEGEKEGGKHSHQGSQLGAGQGPTSCRGCLCQGAGRVTPRRSLQGGSCEQTQLAFLSERAQCPYTRTPKPLCALI